MRICNAISWRIISRIEIRFWGPIPWLLELQCESYPNNRWEIQGRSRKLCYQLIPATDTTRKPILAIVFRYSRKLSDFHQKYRFTFKRLTDLQWIVMNWREKKTCQCIQGVHTDNKTIVKRHFHRSFKNKY